MSCTICEICQEEMKNKVTLKCKHEICLQCMFKISDVKLECPYCRDNINIIIEQKKVITYVDHLQQQPYIPQIMAPSILTLWHRYGNINI